MRRRRRRPRRGDRERRYERLGRDPRRGLRDQVLAPLHRRAAETAVAARRRPPAARAGGRATGRAGARRAVARPHGPVPCGPGRARRPAGSPRPDLRRATRCVHRARPGVGGALDLAARPRRTDAVAARRLGRGRRPRVPRRGALWNTGLFAWGTARFLGEAGAYARELKAAWPALAAGDVPGFFAAVRPVAVDVAVLERSKRLAVVAGTFRWDDIGSWDALLRIRKPDAHGNVVVGKATVADDVRRSVIWSESEHVAVVGLEDMVVVRANGHTLVMPTGRAERLKELVQRL